jgi:hypothetical protein
MWGGFGIRGVRCCPTNSPALQFDSWNYRSTIEALFEAVRLESLGREKLAA